jgi:hypothetical protein
MPMTSPVSRGLCKAMYAAAADPVIRGLPRLRRGGRAGGMALGCDSRCSISNHEKCVWTRGKTLRGKTQGLFNRSWRLKT